MNSTNGSTAGTATPTSGALTKAAARLRRKEEQARRAGAATTAVMMTGPSKTGPKTRRKLPTAQDLERIAVMRSQGIAVDRIGAALQVHKGSVREALKDPSVKGQIAFFRERLRGTQIVAATAIAQKAWEKAELALEQEDAKSWDAYTRGIHAMEKVAASASGENMRMEVTHQGTVPTEPIKIQLQQLIALVREEST